MEIEWRGIGFKNALRKRGFGPANTNFVTGDNDRSPISKDFQFKRFSAVTDDLNASDHCAPRGRQCHKTAISCHKTALYRLRSGVNQCRHHSATPLDLLRRVLLLDENSPNGGVSVWISRSMAFQMAKAVMGLSVLHVVLSCADQAMTQPGLKRFSAVAFECDPTQIEPEPGCEGGDPALDPNAQYSYGEAPAGLPGGSTTFFMIDGSQTGTADAFTQGSGNTWTMSYTNAGVTRQNGFGVSTEFSCDSPNASCYKSKQMVTGCHELSAAATGSTWHSSVEGTNYSYTIGSCKGPTKVGTGGSGGTGPIGGTGTLPGGQQASTCLYVEYNKSIYVNINGKNKLIWKGDVCVKS